MWVEIRLFIWWKRRCKSHPHGCVSWNRILQKYTRKNVLSHPHGCVSWNHKLKITLSAILSHPHGCVSWNLRWINGQAKPSGSHPHGCVSWNSQLPYLFHYKQVTPSRVCELKYDYDITAVYIDVTPSRVCELKLHYKGTAHRLFESHPHGCVSWNLQAMHIYYRSRVTPSRVCELKFFVKGGVILFSESHPHGCVSWNFSNKEAIQNDIRHTLTGVWVEIFAADYHSQQNEVTPSRVCELKSLFGKHNFPSRRSHPHGCVSWNTPYLRRAVGYIRHTLTGVWVEIIKCAVGSSNYSVTPSRVCELKSVSDLSVLSLKKSHPHGCVSWNDTFFNHIF